MTEKDVTTLLVRLLSNNGNPRPFKGNQLSALIKAFLPDFTAEQFGCRNLRDFIKKFAATEIMEIGRAGMDIIYGLRAVGQQQPLFEVAELLPETAKTGDRAPLGQLLNDPRIWKTFASPDAPYRLFLAPSTGNVTVLRPGFTPDPSWVEVPHISADALLQIAKDFVSELPDVQQQPLAATLAQQRWWVSFYDVACTLGLKMRWIYFRRRRIAEQFERSLPTLPPPAPTQPQSSDVKKIPSSLPPASVTRTGVVSNAPQSSLLRRIAADAVQRMTDSELRALNLPLGYVVDALTTR